MSCGVHFGIGFDDHAVRPDEIADALGGLGVPAVARTVGHSDRARRVTEKGEIEIELLRERAVVGGSVEADSEDLDVPLLVVGEMIAEPATLDGSAGGVGFGEEPEHDVLSREISETYRLPCVIQDLEGRGGVTWIEHELLLKLARLRYYTLSYSRGTKSCFRSCRARWH